MKKNLSLAALAGIICLAAMAQPVIKKQKVIGSSGYESFSRMNRTKDGGVIVGGSADTTTSIYSRSVEDYLVVKLDSTGKIEWNKTIGGLYHDILSDIQQTSDGGYILGGTSNSPVSGDKTEKARRSTKDYWIVKLDSTGKIEWDKTIGGRSDDILYSLQQTSNGGYILGGWSWSDMSYEKTENTRGDGDYWIVKLDARGEIEWDKTIGGARDDRFASLQQTNDGGYILGGYSFSNISGEKTEDNKGSKNNSDYWIVKLNSSGVIQWDKTIGGNLSDLLSTVRQTTDGGYILGGLSNSKISGDKTENNRGAYGVFDYWVVKLDSTGKKQWDKTIGGELEDWLECLSQTKDGGYILGGYSYSNISGEKTENNRGSADYWIVKLNAKGEMQWNKTIGGNAIDICYSVLETGKNRYAVGGESYSDISGDKTKISRGNSDFWLVGLLYKPETNSVEITSAGTNLNTTQKNLSRAFTIYPNPAKDMLHIQNTGKATVTLTNQSGKILLAKNINGNGEINVSHLSAGLYYLKNNETGVVQKVIITK